MDTKILANNIDQQHQKISKTSNYGQGRHNYGKGRGKGYGKQCSFCHKMNHTADECYSKHEYPPWMKHRVNYNVDTTEEDRDHENERGKHIFNDAVNEKIFKAIDPEQLQHLLDMIQN